MIKKANYLDKARKERGLTYEDLSKIINSERSLAWLHCHMEKIPAEAVIKYSSALEIPLKLLRPDLPDPLLDKLKQEKDVDS